MNVSVILPSYNPTVKLEIAVNNLINAGFTDIILVDDGSRTDTQIFFENATKNPAVTVLHHEFNKGKGRALKTGFEFFLKNRQDSVGVVTTDDDGQHNPEDIKKCAEKMAESGEAVFGARDFSGIDIPKKSRFGNNTTRFVFNIVCGIKITDTQTGLRAIPKTYLQTLIDTSGEKFEYETNMLLKMKQKGLTFTEIPIKTIYCENNSETHFRPIRDSIKIYAVIFKYILSSLSASLIDLAIFTLLNLLLPAEIKNEVRIAAATAGARVVSSAVNFTVNRKTVFKSSSRLVSSLIKYYILCVFQLALSYALVLGLSTIFSQEQSVLQTVIKMIVDTVLFALCFVVQREWVFKEKTK